RTELQALKWNLIQRFIKENPFRVSAQVSRAEQWYRVLRYVRENIAEESLEDWIREQAAIAENIAAGIRDLRPRKSGPCHSILLVHVRDRARKAEAIHHWTIGAEQANGCDGGHQTAPLPGERVAACFSSRDSNEPTD
ncbi:MAG: hypothetical protein OQK23_00300, partial [Rhodospirillales bacterium]|nr:hypothetical protein [Rhodospirillales bacterium]